jgi:DNA-binding CsgD family transcriptional regulator
MLVGRDREQVILVQTLSDARSNHGSVLAIVGEPGIGKSALLAYAEEQADGMNVLRARGVQSEAKIPFAGLFELLRPALAALGRIPGPQAAALEGALALRPARGEDRFAIGAATLSLLAAYAEQSPLLLVIDDAHWLDGSSANAVLFAARRLAADPVAVVLAVRGGEPSLLDSADLPTLRLAGLDLAASGELLRQRATEPGQHRGADRITDRLHHETGGNPLALLELAESRDWFEPTPLNEPLPVVVSVAGVYAGRFRSLEDGPRRVLVLIAASDSGDLALLARAAEAIGLTVDDLAPAEAAGLVTVRAGRVEWRHPLARSAIYGDASPAERRGAHRALADALPDADEDRRAWHLALAALGPDEAVSSALEQAGIRARDRSAYDVASGAFERAASLAPVASRRGYLLYAAADAAWLGGLAVRTSDLLDEAELHAGDPEVEISIEHLRGHIALHRGPVGEGQSILLAAGEKAAMIDPPRAVVILSEAVNACFYAGDAPVMRRTADRVARTARRCTDARSEFFATMTAGMTLVFTGDGDGGPELIRKAVALLERSDELRDDPRLLVWAAMGPLWLREAASGRALVDRALAIARSRSAVGVLPCLLTHVALDRATSDRWVEAQALFHEAILLARESGQHSELAIALARLSWMEARRGREEDCRAHAAEALELSQTLGLGPCEIWALSALGDLELGLSRPEAALVCLEEQQGALLRRGINDVDLSPGPELVEVYLRIGRVQQAVEAAAAFGRDAEVKGQPWAMARAARAHGLVAADDQFDACFAEAIKLHAATPDAFEAARTYLAYGSRLRRSRQRVRAREELRVAIEIFDRLGAEPWSDLARAELAATGETVRRRDPTTLNQLTPQELQIALLLAERRTTRETGAALFLSPKTVEYHLRSIYRKLDISSRDELVAAMAESR